MTLFRFIIICLLSLFSLTSSGADKELEKEATVFNQTFSWQAMIAATGIYSPSILEGVDQQKVDDYFSLSLLIDLYYKGFFIQSNHRRAESLFRGAEIGYQLHVEDNWGIDIVGKTYLSGYEPDELIDDNDANIPTLEGLEDRKHGVGLGLRYSYYYQQDIFSVDLARITADSNSLGWMLESYYSHLIPYRNWDIYLGLGLSYFNNKITDYYVGINENEINSAREIYEADDSYKAQFEIYAQYPLSKHWSFNTGITHSYYSNEMKNSPIVDTQNITQVMLGVMYVF